MRFINEWLKNIAETLRNFSGDSRTELLAERQRK